MQGKRERDKERCIYSEREGTGKIQSKEQHSFESETDGFGN